MQRPPYPPMCWCGHLQRKAVTTKVDPMQDLIDTVTAAPGAELMYDYFVHQLRCGARRLESGLKRKQRKHEHDADYAWRMAHADLDRFLAHCEVAGRVVRRWALDAHRQHLVLKSGRAIELSADEVLGQSRALATGVPVLRYKRKAKAKAKATAA